MPQTAIRDVGVDHVLPVAQIAETIVQLTGVPVEKGRTVAENDDRADVTETGTSALRHASSLGPPSPFTCPECGGALWELRDGELVRFQCHVGHGFSGESLMDSQSEALEAALWSALRALEESAALRQRMADNARPRGMEQIANGYEAHAQDRWARADLIRTVLLSDSPPGITTAEVEPRAGGD
jgi:two-component system chemotaxis response regulator CheB